MIRGVWHFVGIGQMGCAYKVSVGKYEGIFLNIKAHTLEQYKKISLLKYTPLIL
jgi:hypothetical protein